MKTELEIKIEKYLELLMTDDHDPNGLTCQEKIKIATTDLLNLFSVYVDEVSRERILEFLVHLDSVMYPAIMSEYDKWFEEQEEKK